MTAKITAAAKTTMTATKKGAKIIDKKAKMHEPKLEIKFRYCLAVIGKM